MKFSLENCTKVSQESGVDSSSLELLRELLRDVKKINTVLVSEKMKVVRSRNELSCETC